jgi:hypothetical protein
MAVFLLAHLAYPVLIFTRQPSPSMITRTSFNFLNALRASLVALFLLPALAMAHPGHYHPGEEDEFDALRADYLHLHGFWEIGLALLALAAVVVFKMNKNRGVRVAAAFAIGGSLALIAAF